MRHAFLFIFLVICGGGIFSQNAPSKNNKPSIDFESIKKWPSFGTVAISDDGRYAAYSIYNRPTEGSSILVVKDTESIWQKEFIFLKSSPAFFFTGKSNEIVFMKSDTLFLYFLGTDRFSFFTHIASYKVSAAGKGEWIAYKINNKINELILYNLASGRTYHYSSVADYSFSEKGNTLLLKTSSIHDSLNETALQWIKLPESSAISIWSSASTMDRKISLNSYNFDITGDQLVFMVHDKKSEQEVNAIWYYKFGMTKATMKISSDSKGIEEGYSISNSPPAFSQNGDNIFFELKKVEESRKKDPDAAKVDVWSYKDVILQSQQLNVGYYRNWGLTFSAALNLQTDRVIRLENSSEELVTYPGAVPADFVVISDKRDCFWWEEKKKTYYLLSLKDGSRKLLGDGWSSHFSFSPFGKYIVYFNGKKGKYFSYDMTSGAEKNISEAIPVRLENEYAYYVPGRTLPEPFSIAKWIGQDNAFLVYDNYDIWKLDPSGKGAPDNITDGYGRQHHIKFRLVYEKNENKDAIEQKDNPLLLTAFNVDNKYNGFYRKRIGKPGGPELLSMLPARLYRDNSQIPNQDYFSKGMRPIKARDTDVWIVQKETSTEAPNFYLTTDFKTYRALTDLKPEKAYNWFTTELVTWKQLDGTPSQGILYKPEDFDPHKKYPLIFSYYETFSYRMYEFPKPDYTEDRINIPWYVSRGYLVFTPDIHFSIANISGKVSGDCAVNSIVSAAQYLSKLPYVNASRIGIQGHSYSGGETLYLITHSTMFAAACAAASTVSDEISAYLSISRPNGKAAGPFRSTHAEIGHDRIGATLWQRPDLYIKASPVFGADKVTTPLLIMHNQADGIDWGQSVEMYMALRRLKKKVWMLQYDDGEHSVSGKSAMDYTIRMTQFFDYYLKDVPPPKWMTEGIPARLKGIESKYELDTSGKRP